MVNNNVLATLVLVAIVVSVAGIVSTANLLSSGLSVTGAATGTTNVTVGTSVAISLIINEVDFGTMSPGENNDTTDDSPLPFLVRNDGNVNVNVSLYANDGLWTQTGYDNDTAYFQVKCGNNESTCDTSVTSWQNVPGAIANNITVLANLPYAAASDEQQVEVNVTVPPEEQAGVKSSTLTFTGFQA